MYLRAFAILFFIHLSYCGYSQDKHKSIIELIELQKQDSLLAKMFYSTLTPYMASEKDPVKREKLQNQANLALPIIERLNKTMVETDLPAIYDKYYSADEIEQILAFYKSPVGKKVLQNSQVIVNELMNILTVKYLPVVHEEMSKINSGQYPPNTYINRRQ